MSADTIGMLIASGVLVALFVWFFFIIRSERKPKPGADVAAALHRVAAALEEQADVMKEALEREAALMGEQHHADRHWHVEPEEGVDGFPIQGRLARM